MIPCNFHACTTILSRFWVSKIEEAVNHPKYGRLYHCKYSQILGCHNNWIIINYVEDRTDEEIYKHINQTILNGNLMNTSLIVMKGKYAAIDYDDSSCHG